MRVTDQYFWNFVFGLFFLALIVMGAVALDSATARDFATLTFVDYALMTLASWRLIRLFVYDTVTKFVREQFYDATKVKGGGMLEKPARGPRRTLADLFSCPWCFGVWATALVVFCYMAFPWAIFPIAFLALSAVASFLQILSNLVGHKAEQLKNQNEGRL